MKYPHLFSPVSIRGHVLKNRIQAAPLQNEANFCDGNPTIYMAGFYEKKAADGAAIVTVGDSAVNRDNAATGAVVTMTLYDMDRWKKQLLSGVTYGITRHGAVAGIQLNHGGIRNKTSAQPPLGPSRFLREDGVWSKEMDRADMDAVIADFVRCACNAKAAGFNMIQLNAGHGWLLSQFMSPAINTRTDEYGGSLENRARFAMELLDALRAAIGEDMIIDYRVSGDDLMEGGMRIDDVAAYIKLIEDKIDLVNISVGTIWNMPDNNYMFPLWFVPHGCNVEMAARVKATVSKCLVSVVGGISDPDMAENIVASGKADLVAICRGLVADPDWCTKALEGRGDEIIPCVRCINCHEMFSPGENGNCAVNPWSLRRHWLKDIPTPAAARRVVVIGGGVGGMQAAITAAQRGHRVILLEKRDHLGGTMDFTDGRTVKTDLRAFKDWQIRMVEKLGVEVRLNTPATPAYVTALEPHAVIAAIGSEPILPSIPGATGETVLPALDVYRSPERVGQRVIVIGGNLTGTELAIDLAQFGKDVTLVEMTDRVAAGAPTFYGLGVQEELETHADRLSICTGTTVTAIHEDGVTVTCKGAARRLPADTVVLAVGYRPRQEEAERFRACALRFRAVGDCKAVRKLKQAVEDGFFAALDIL